MMKHEAGPTSRDFDLMEVALQTSAETCNYSEALRGSRKLDPLAKEYLHALAAVERWRKDMGR